MNTYYVVTAEHGSVIASASDISSAADLIVRRWPDAEILAVASAGHIYLVVNALEGFGPEDDDGSETLRRELWGRIGGKSKSKIKRAAARTNGAKGGRPRGSKNK